MDPTDFSAVCAGESCKEYLCLEYADCPAKPHGLCGDCEEKAKANCNARGCPHSGVSTWKASMRECAGKSCEEYLCRDNADCPAQPHGICSDCWSPRRVLTCKKGHKLHRKQTDAEDVICDVCDGDGRNWLGIGKEIYNCATCGFDACALCFKSPPKFVYGDIVTIVGFGYKTFKVVRVTHGRPGVPPIYEVDSTKSDLPGYKNVAEDRLIFQDNGYVEVRSD